jgi:hypothetical protein
VPTADNRNKRNIKYPGKLNWEKYYPEGGGRKLGITGRDRISQALQCSVA